MLFKPLYLVSGTSDTTHEIVYDSRVIILRPAKKVKDSYQHTGWHSLILVSSNR